MTDTRDDAEPSPDDGSILRTQCDWDDVSPSIAVVESVAIALDRDSATMEPLFASIDPDELDALVQSGDGGDAELTVAFDFAGVQVTVHRSGTVVVRAGTDTDESDGDGENHTSAP